MRIRLVKEKKFDGKEFSWEKSLKVPNLVHFLVGVLGVLGYEDNLRSVLELSF